MSISYTKTLPILGEYDVVVAGGGPAGIGAAVRAARDGARVLMIERSGVLGGNLTLGHVCPLLGSVAPGTFYDEVAALFMRGHEDAPIHKTRNGVEIPIDHEEAKCRLTALVAESGAEFWLSTPIVDTLTESNRVTGVVVSTATGLGAVMGKVVIDATGDGTVAALAGAEFAIGRDSDGLTQPCTIEFLVTGVDESVGISAWGGSDPVKLPDGREYRQVCRAAAESGELPSNVTIVRLHRTFRPGERSVNATQYNGLDAFDPASVADAERSLRAQIEQIMAFLRRNVPGYENIRVVSSAGSLGVRETRRILGDYILNDTDVEQGTHRPDAAVRDAWFLIDIHNPSGGGQAEGHSQPAKPYDIPFACLLPRGLEGIMTAGRCISGTHRAHASYRVMAICLATGEAAGMVAAKAAKTGKTPREVAPTQA